MTDDREMTDEAQRVAMTAAAAGARVIETATREIRERVERDRSQAERQRAEAALRGISGPNGWDAQRPQREAARAADQAMTPASREAFRVADLSSGLDPAQAAATGRKGAKPTTAPAPVKVPEISAGR